MSNLKSSLYFLRSRLKGFHHDIAWVCGINQSRYKKAKGARILVYHGICDTDPLRFNTLFITRENFETQLRYYKKYFNVVSLDDYYTGNYTKDRFTVCITFDDGFANNYHYVLPLLEQYQVPATFFITGIRQAGYDILWNDGLCLAYQYGPPEIVFEQCTFIKGADKRYTCSSTGQLLADWLRSSAFENKKTMMKVIDSYKNKSNEAYWLQLTEEQIKKMSESNWVTIGSHGYYHNDLAKLDIDSLQQELILSKQFLENSTGKAVNALAFPYGSYSQAALCEAQRAGYTQLLATELLSPEDKGNMMLRERLTVNPFISTINQMHANITGNYK